MGLVAACATLVVALPAPAVGQLEEASPPPKETGAPPPDGSAPPPEEESAPPPEEDGSPPPEGAGPIPGADLAAPPAEKDGPVRDPFAKDPGAEPQETPSEPAGSEPPPEGRRVGIQSIGSPEESDTSVGADGGAPGRVEPTRLAAARRETLTPRDAVRRVIRSAAPAAPKRSSSPIATVAAGDAPAAAARRRAAVAQPEQPLPVRLVPRQLRRIVEVVPGELWAALGGLALLALALAISSWLTTMRARRLQRQREALLEEVGVLQAALLPRVADDVPASVAYLPADGERAGGDFYDAFALADGSTGMILGEVSPEGHESLARTTFVRYTLRAYLEAGMSPREVVKVGSQALAEHLQAGFAAVTVATYDRASGRFTYASAGHAPPLVIGPERFEPVTACSAPPLGLDEPTGFRQTTITLTAGSLACLYTRGLTESRRDGRPLGVERLEAELRALPEGASAARLLERFEGIAEDCTADMAACLVRAPADAPVDGARIEEFEVDERDVGDSLERFLRACGVPLPEVPGILREAGEAARREGTATVRVRMTDFRPGVDVMPGNLVRLEDRRTAVLI